LNFGVVPKIMGSERVGTIEKKLFWNFPVLMKYNRPPLQSNSTNILSFANIKSAATRGHKGPSKFGVS
jgi:hypothetical protein